MIRSNRTQKESDELIEHSFNVHNQCLIGEDLNSSTCTNEPNYNWCKMSHDTNAISTNEKMSSINDSNKRKKSSTGKKNCMMERFNDGMNVSGISRRQILANIDCDSDGQFMCSTLIKDASKENDEKLKEIFHQSDQYRNANELGSINRSSFINNPISEQVNRTGKLSDHKLEQISKQLQEAETVKQMKVSRKTNSLHRNEKSNCYKNGDKLDEELIYDSRKPFSDLSSIEEARLDNLRNNLKNMQMNSIDKRRILNKYFNDDCTSAKRLDRHSLIEDENLRSEMYNSENSTFINQMKQIQNYHNNQIIHDLNDENTWFCKTKLYDETLDSIVRKWATLDHDIWCKIICLERNRIVAKAYIRLPYFIVGTVGNNILFDGYTVGLNGSENIYRDQETDFIVKNLDKGVRIKIDEEGNLLIRKMTHLSVQVKDWIQSLEGQGALSDDIILCNGKIPFNKPVKVFDIDRFAHNLRRELEKPFPNRRNLAKQCIVAISFGKVTYNVLNSPSWLMVVNVHALRMIEKTQRIYSIPSIRIPVPDYCLSTISIDDNLNRACSKEDEETSSSSCSNGLDSMNSNSEDSNQYYSGGFINKNIYSSI